MKACTNCNLSYSDTVKYCKNCGSEIKDVTNKTSLGINQKKSIKNLITKELNLSDIIGVIPVSSKRLKINVLKKSLSPSFGTRFVIFLISLPIAYVILGLPLFILADFGAFYSLIGLSLITLGLIYYLFESIYINRIQKSPDAMIIFTKNDLLLLLVNNYKIELIHNYEIGFDAISKHLYGEINNNALGPNFEIRKDNKTLTKGKLRIKNNKYLKHNIDKEILLPIDELRKIVIGK